MVKQSRYIKRDWSKRKRWLLIAPFFLLLLVLAWAQLNQSFNQHQALRKLSLDYQVGPVAFSPDGRFLVAGEDLVTAQVRMWDLKTGQILHTIKTGHDHGVGSLAISPDKKLLATCSVEDDTQLLLWDVQTGRRVSQLRMDLKFTHSLFFSRDGTLLVAAGSNRSDSNSGAIEVWDVQKEQLLRRTLEPQSDVFAASMIDGKTLLIVSGDGVKLRDLRSGTLLRTLSKGIGKECVKMALSPNGQTLAVGTRVAQGQAEYIDLIGIQNSTLQLTLLENRGTSWGLALKSLAFSTESRLIASSSIDPQIGKGEVQVRDAKTGLSRATLKLEAQSLAFSPDGETLAIATQREVHLWKVDALLKRGIQ